MSVEEGTADHGRLLATVRSPQDVKRMSTEQLGILAAEIRDFLIAKVSRTGGTSGPTSVWSS